MPSLESVDFELVGFDETDPDHPVADVLALVALQLEHLAVLGVLYHGAIACKLLETKKKLLRSIYPDTQ
jgi:hypothetical protein